MAQYDLFGSLNNSTPIGSTNYNLAGAASNGNIGSGRQLRDLQQLLNAEMQISKVRKKNRELSYKENGLIKGVTKMMQRQLDLSVEYSKNKKAQKNLEKDLVNTQKMYAKEAARNSSASQNVLTVLKKQMDTMEYQVRLEKLKTGQMKRMLPLGGRLAGVFNGMSAGAGMLHGAMKDVSSVVSLLLAPLKLLGDLLMAPYNTFLRMQSITGNLAADIGLTSKESYRFKDNFGDLANGALKFGGTMEDVATAMKSWSEMTNKNKMFDRKQIEAITELAYATGLGMEGATEMVATFDNIGISFSRGIELTNEARDVAAKYNLNSTALLKNLNGFAKQLNGYEFKNGISGLTQIVAKAQSLRYDLNSIGSVAQKLFDPEGAIEASAQLQVLGGKFAEMGDPFGLMYAAQNAPEELAKKLMEVTKGMAEKGKDGIFYLPPANRKIITEAANALGENADNLINAALEQGKTADKMSSNKFLSSGMFSEDQQQMLSNLMSFSKDKGGYVIRMPEGFDQLVSTIPSSQEFNRILTERENNEKAAIERKNWAERFNIMIERFMIGFAQPFVKIEGIFNNSDLFDKIEQLGGTIADMITPLVNDAFSPNGGLYKFIDSLSTGVGNLATQVNTILGGQGTIWDKFKTGMEVLFKGLVDVVLPYFKFAFDKLLEGIGNILPDWAGGASLRASGQRGQAEALAQSPGLQVMAGGQNATKQLIDKANASMYQADSAHTMVSGVLGSVYNSVSGLFGALLGGGQGSLDQLNIGGSQLMDVFGGGNKFEIQARKDMAAHGNYATNPITVQDGVLTPNGQVIKYPKGELLSIMSPQQNVSYDSGSSIKEINLSGTIRLETPVGNTTLTLEDFKKAGIHLIANAIGHEQEKSAKGYGLNDSKDIKTTLAI